MPKLDNDVRDRCRAIGKERGLKNWWDDRDAVEEQAYKDLDRVLPPRRKRQKKAKVADECCVCMDTVPLVILAPCGHKRTCAACFDRCQRRCPTCRAVVTSVMKRVFA